MTIRNLLYALCGLGLLFAISMTYFALRVDAQSKKPSKALRQVVERQNDLFEKFDREVSKGKAQSYEWEARTDDLRRLAAERAAEFKISAWKDEELMSLATLYQFAEQYGLAADAFRAYLKSNPNAKRVGGIDVRSSYARALLETDQLDEAGKVLDEMYRVDDDDPAILASRIALSKDLAIALRDRGRMEDAAKRARKGYGLADAANRDEMLRSRLRETTLRDQFTLAALHASIKQRLGQRREADDFNRLVLKYDFTNQPSLRSFYESELTSARLIGGSAPELTAAQWLDGRSIKLSELRGKVVLLDYWAMWCSPCIAAFPRLREFRTKFEGKGFEIIGVTRLYGRSDKEEDLSRDLEMKSLHEYKRRHQLTYPIAVGKMDDVTNEESYSVTSLPTVILIDRRGNIRHFKRGVGEYNKLEKQIAGLIDEM